MNNLMSELAAVPAITIVCALLSEVYKSSFRETAYKHIPALCGVCGAVLGMVCYVMIPDYIPASNALVAAAIGIVSGWSATGVHQILKQYSDNSK